MPEEVKKRNAFEKMFRNEIGEFAFRKVGTWMGSLAVTLIGGVIDGELALQIGKILAGISAALLIIGQVEKNDRAAKK